jgi:DNA (cytosine-5)-methyltransferase 1
MLNTDLKFIDLFAGIGGIKTGFMRAGFECLYSNDIDPYCKQTFDNNFDIKLDISGIKAINPQTLPDYNILVGGFPCQAFSIAGHKQGFEDTRGTLFFDIARIVNYHKPQVVFLENVKGLKSHNKGKTFQTIKNTLSDMGYFVHAQVLNAKDFGVPQNRERIYIVAFLENVDFEFPQPLKNTVVLGDILEKNVDAKYTISDKLWAGHQRRKIEHIEKGNGFGYSLFNENSPYTSTISARYYKDGSEILIEQQGQNPRKITPREAARLQGFPENYKIPVSDVQAYKQFGNSVCVPVIKALAKNIFEALNRPIEIRIKKPKNLFEYGITAGNYIQYNIVA